MKELLILLANYPYRSSNKEALTRSLNGVIDWDSFVRLVNDHGIIALAAYNIKEAGLEPLIPAKTMAVLENGLMQSMVRNAWLTERWKGVNKILYESGIKHILLKGMALEHTIYAAKGLRQMNDNDILIRKDEALKAWKILQANGFIPKMVKSSLHNKIITDSGKHLPELNKNGYVVEIHTRLFDEITDDKELYERIFSDASEIDIGNEKGYIMPDALHLKYLINHHTRHKMEGNCQVRTYSDIILLDPDNGLNFPDEFVYSPDQCYKRHFRKNSYRRAFNSIPPGYRLRYLAGDIFPSVVWMKQRYGCRAIMAVLRYPQRMLKLLWLI